MSVRFDVDGDTLQEIIAVVDRAKKDLPVTNVLELTMDLTACHASGTPLDFGRLLTFPPYDFAHDIGGIQNHIDRRTGQLRDFFSPRCAV